MNTNHVPAMGKVYLVGAGPGDAGLLTLRGLECLRQADAVLYDFLVNPRIVEWARPGAECICLGQHGRERLWTQDEINQRLLELARVGRIVVRLKGGDPAVFARGAEELEVLVEHGVPFEIVPGVTAALAAASYAQVPITRRDVASAVALVAGQQNQGRAGEPLDYERLASFPGTLMFYMGVTSAPEWTAALLRGGKPPDTPAAIVRRCTLADQVTLRCTLAEIPDVIRQRRLRPPAIIMVGEAVGRAPACSWFENRPLFGRTVLVTRPAQQAAALAELLAGYGAHPLVQPAIAIREPEDWGPVDRALAQLDQFDWIVFSSVNGVEALLERLPALGRDLRALGAVRLAAIGPGTAGALRKYRLEVDRQPDRFQAEDLAESLVPGAAGRRFLLARASRGREILAERLQQAGGDVTQVTVYRSLDVEVADPAVEQMLDRGEIAWVTVTSSAIARSLAKLFGPQLARAKLVSISPVTSATLRELGFPPAAEACEATMAGVVQAVVEAEMRGV